MRIFLFIVGCWIGLDTNAQTVLGWSDLSEGISWEVPSPENIFPAFQEANFSPKMKALEGKKVVITGYLLVLDSQQSIYLLSKNPMASCFFCGNGGPETVLDLKFVEKPSFVMDELLSVEGILYLNENNPNACYYRIEDADAISFK
ncbi:DUF3299 domain-containing protein [Ulvibacterium marinum]|uniref:DUF3299 domain-containing protein n=1 Tax=Ulvibacterium marinum TaxID=2419782 RepID=UPI000EA9832F|nr:DUF3299 domain-containing protein [Ulvibacterium marinum]